MPDLGRIARCTSLVCQIYGIENRRFFIDIFSVDLVRSDYKPAFFLLVSTDPEEDGHESFSGSWKSLNLASAHIAVPVTAGARLSVSR